MTVRVAMVGRLLAHVLLPAALLAACSGDSLGPDSPARLTIEVDAVAARELTLDVGASAFLTARLGEDVVDGGRITWQSSDPGVLGVSADGIAEARAPGAARVVACCGAHREILYATVLAAAPAGTCEAPESALSLGVGEMMTARASDVPELCLAGGAEYLLVPFNASITGTGTTNLRIRAEGGLGGRRGSAGLSPAPELSPGAPLVATTLPTSTAFDRRLRQLEARELAPLVRRHGVAHEPTAAFAGVPVVGDTRTLNVNSQRTCSEAINRTARVVGVTERSVLLVDEGNPAGGLSANQYSEIGRLFDEIIYPTVVENFGAPTDIDGNGRILILFTRAVNELTERASSSFVGGFFYSRDLFPRREADGLGACEASNVAEILYVLAPDPQGVINGNARPASFVADRVPGILAHELQHLIGAGRRLRVHGHRDWSEEFWLNEGLSHIAEELTFYAASGLGSGRNISLGTLRGSSRSLGAFDRFQGSNILRYANFLESPGASSPLVGTDVATRGASWAFLRYAADRSGQAGTAFWRGLIDSEFTGYENLMTAIGASPASWMNDWAAALFADDFLQTDAALQQPSWNFRSIVPAMAAPGNTSLPLRVQPLRASGPTEANVAMVPGGAAFIRFTVLTDQTVVLYTESGAQPPGPNIRLNVLRLR